MLADSLEAIILEKKFEPVLIKVMGRYEDISRGDLSFLGKMTIFADAQEPGGDVPSKIGATTSVNRS